MEQLRDLAITLRAVTYQERHRVVTALTEHHGKITVLARNSIQSRRFGGTLDPFTAAEWFLSNRPGSEFYHLERAQIRRGFEELRRDFDRLALASFFNELMLQLAPEREPCLELFKLHANALAILAEAPPTDSKLPSLLLLNTYLAKVLQWAGNQPPIGRCLECQKSLEHLEPSAQVTLIVAEAGWVCLDCRTSGTRQIQALDGLGSLHHLDLRVSARVIHDFLMSLTQPIRQAVTLAEAGEADHRTLYRFLEALFAYFVPGFSPTSVRSLKFLGIESTALLVAASQQQTRPHPA